MTNEQAHKILHPSTSKEAIFEIQSRVGFDKEKGIKIVEEACLVACEAIEKQIPKKIVFCDNCGNKTVSARCPRCFELVTRPYCRECGQRLDGACEWQ